MQNLFSGRGQQISESPKVSTPLRWVSQKKCMGDYLQRFLVTN